MTFQKGNTLSKGRIPWNKGKHLSEQHKLNISNGEKGRIFSDEHRKKLSKACKGRIISEEQRQNISNTLKGRPLSEETKRKISESKKGIHPLGLKKYVKENSAWNKGIVGEEYLIHYPNGMTHASVTCDTLPERMFENQLLFNNILYVKQFPYGLGIADFWLPETNTIVEVDGIYWHSKPEVIERDKRKNAYLEQEDYNLFRFTDKEILENAEKCVEKVI